MNLKESLLQKVTAKQEQAVGTSIPLVIKLCEKQAENGLRTAMIPTWKLVDGEIEGTITHLKKEGVAAEIVSGEVVNYLKVVW